MIRSAQGRKTYKRIKKAPSLNPNIKRRSIHSAVPLSLPQTRPLNTHPTTRLPCNGGNPFHPAGKTAFSGQLPDQFHRFLTLPCTGRQLSADRTTITFSVHHLFNMVLSYSLKGELSSAFLLHHIIPQKICAYLSLS